MRRTKNDTFSSTTQSTTSRYGDEAVEERLYPEFMRVTWATLANSSGLEAQRFWILDASRKENIYLNETQWVRYGIVKMSSKVLKPVRLFNVERLHKNGRDLCKFVRAWSAALFVSPCQWEKSLIFENHRLDSVSKGGSGGMELSFYICNVGGWSGTSLFK